MDESNACLQGLDGEPLQDAAYVHNGLSVPNSCTVCTPAAPCLFDVLADPRETTNIAGGRPDLVREMSAKLGTFVFYVPGLSHENMACYTCPSHPPVAYWQGFSGPCCVPNNASTGGLN